VTDEITSEEDDFKDQRLHVFLTLLDNFDVLALQEVWNVCAPQRFQKLIGQAEARGFKHWFRSGCYPLRKKPTDGMLLVLSRHPLHMPGEVIYDACAGIDCIAGKGALAVRIRPFGETMCDFDLLSTHLQSGENHETRQAQMLQMRGFLDEHGSGVESVTTVVAGDLNLNVSSAKEHGVVDETFPDFVDVLITDGRPAMGTAAFKGVVTQNPEKESAGRVDYVLYRPGRGSRWLPNSSLIETFVVQGEKFTTLSDHFGVAATMVC